MLKSCQSIWLKRKLLFEKSVPFSWGLSSSSNPYWAAKELILLAKSSSSASLRAFCSFREDFLSSLSSSKPIKGFSFWSFLSILFDLELLRALSSLRVLVQNYFVFFYSDFWIVDILFLHKSKIWNCIISNFLFRRNFLSRYWYFR